MWVVGKELEVVIKQAGNTDPVVKEFVIKLKGQTNPIK